MLGRLLGWSNAKVAPEPIAWEFALSGEAEILQLRILRNSKPASFAQVIFAWSEDADFRLAFSDALLNCQFAAFRWELPRLTSAVVHRTFECVIVDSPSLLSFKRPSFSC